MSFNEKKNTNNWHPWFGQWGERKGPQKTQQTKNKKQLASLIWTARFNKRKGKNPPPIYSGWWGLTEWRDPPLHLPLPPLPKSTLRQSPTNLCVQNGEDLPQAAPLHGHPVLLHLQLLDLGQQQPGAPAAPADARRSQGTSCQAARAPLGCRWRSLQPLGA